MAHAGVWADRTGNLGRRARGQRALRSALHLRHLWNGAVLHADRDWSVRSALEASGDAASVSLRRVSVDTGDLRSDRHSLDFEHDYHAAQRSAGRDDDCADWRAGIFVLEVAWKEGSRGSRVKRLDGRAASFARLSRTKPSSLHRPTYTGTAVFLAGLKKGIFTIFAVTF